MKKIYFSAFFFCLFFESQAQSTFIKQLSASGIKNVLATNDGGYLVTTNYNILKFNSNDSLVWSKTVSDSSTMYFQQAIVLQKGGYAFLCKSGAEPHTDAEVVKLDNNLNVTWRKRLFGDIPLYIAEDWSGNLLIAAHNQGETDNSNLIKLDANGNGVWLRNLSNPHSNAYITSIKVTADKKYVTGGENNDGTGIVIFDSTGNQLMLTSYETNVAITPKAELFNNGNILLITSGNEGFARMDNTGNIIWKKTLTTENTQVRFESANIIDKGILLGGYKTGTFDVDSVLVIGAFSSTGNCLWLKQITTPSRTSAVSITKLKNGSYIIAAAGRPYFQYNHGTSFTIKLNASGNGCSSNKINFTQSDGMFTLRESKPYAAVLLNFQNPKMILNTVFTAPSTLICGNAPLQSQQDISSANNKVIEQSLKLTVYPNPVTNYINLSFTSNKAANSLIQIFDVAGNSVLQLPINVMVGKNAQVLNVSALRSGAYTVKLTANNTNLKTTFYKE